MEFYIREKICLYPGFSHHYVEFLFLRGKVTSIKYLFFQYHFFPKLYLVADMLQDRIFLLLGPPLSTLLTDYRDSVASSKRKDLSVLWATCERCRQVWARPVAVLVGWSPG